MKYKEEDIVKLMEALYGEKPDGAADRENTGNADPELADELDDLRQVRASLSQLKTPATALLPPFVPPGPARLARMHKRRPLYRAAAAAAGLLLIGFTLGKTDIRFEKGSVTFAWGHPTDVPQPPAQVQAPAAFDTLMVLGLIQKTLTQYRQEWAEAVANTRSGLRKNNNTQLASLQDRIETNLNDLHRRQEAELSNLIARLQESNLRELAGSMAQSETRQQEQIKWMLQQGFSAWNARREQDIEHLRSELGQVYNTVQYQQTEQDKLNRALIQQTALNR
jgi:hypothetical protein